MSDPHRFAFQFGNTPAARPLDPGQPMRILVLGDFSGRGFGVDRSVAAKTTLAQRKIQRVDIDSFEDRLANHRPTVQVRLGDRSNSIVDIEVRELDDFHPDNLYRKVPVFHELHDLRKRLLDPQTFSEAAALLLDAMPQALAETETESGMSTESESDHEAVERILGRPAGQTESSGQASSKSGIGRLIDEIVAPYVLPQRDPRQDECVRSIDSAVAAQMRTILHDGAFQSLEAVWRGLHFLLSNAAADEEVQVSILDVAKSELFEALKSESGRVEDSLLYQRLVTERDEEPWSLFVGDMSFGEGELDLSLLSGLGAIGAHAGGPILATADPRLLGYETWTDELRVIDPGGDKSGEVAAWSALRSSDVAPWIALASPRFLLRLPYGAATDPIDAFAFEELENPATDHERYLWGASSLLCATLMATSFLENGWSAAPFDHLEFDDLPAATFAVDGETQLKPCAEVYLAERIAESFLDHGVMPLMSFKNRNAVRLLRFQSIAGPLEFRI